MASSAVPSASDVSSSLPSSSAWQWQAEYGLFFSPARNLWAQYDHQTGQYTYLPSGDPQPSSTDASEPLKEEGELSDEDYTLDTQARPPPASSTGRTMPDYDDPDLYAFPSSSSARPATTSSSTTSHSTLRLLLLSSSCLPPSQTIALLSSLQPDGYTIGRDKQLSPEDGRIRLREMEVSKSHAVVYHTGEDGEAERYVDRDGDGADLESGREWDRGKVKERERAIKWWIVDSGSVHGTWVKKAKDRRSVEDGSGGLTYDDGPDGSGLGDSKKAKKAKTEKGKRLSEPKTASLPSRLEHGDLLTVGSTVFEIHLHARDLPCAHCTLPSTASLIPTSLAPTLSSSKSSSPPPPDTGSWDAILTREHGPVRPLLNPKEKLKQLKAEMLARPSVSTSAGEAGTGTAGEYRDRAALRRQAFPDEPGPPKPWAHHQQQQNKKRKTVPATGTATTSYASGPTLIKPATTTVSAAPTTYAALPTTNKGHTLLMKHGWTPGSALGGAEGGGRVEPVEVTRLAGEGRKGLGVKKVAVVGQSGVGGGGAAEEGDWRDQGRERRWREMGLGGR